MKMQGYWIRGFCGFFCGFCSFCGFFFVGFSMASVGLGFFCGCQNLWFLWLRLRYNLGVFHWLKGFMGVYHLLLCLSII